MGGIFFFTRDSTALHHDFIPASHLMDYSLKAYPKDFVDSERRDNYLLKKKR